MTKQEIINIIQGAIVANGTNDITADVLRPVLVSMSTQINDLVGALSNLTTTNKSNIVNAINDVLNASGGAGGIVVRTGTANPNTSPPPTVNLGDFYNQTFNGGTINFYIFNGAEWVLLVNNEPSLDGMGGLREYTENPAIIPPNISAVVYVGSTVNSVIQLPDSFVAEPREITIVNQSSNAIRVQPQYVKFNGDATTVLDSYKSITVKAKSLTWYQIR